MSKEIKFKVAGCQATSSNPNHRTVMVSAYVYRADGELEKELHLSLFNHDPRDFYKGQELTLIIPENTGLSPEPDEGTLMVDVGDTPLLISDEDSISVIEPYPLPALPAPDSEREFKELPVNLDLV